MATHLDQLIAEAAELETSELEVFVGQASSLLAQRKIESPAIQEVKLLQTINECLPKELETRYSRLRSKVENNTITQAEHRELIDLIDIVEQADAKRLQALIALSKLRQISLTDLMNQLGIHPPPTHG